MTRNATACNAAVRRTGAIVLRAGGRSGGESKPAVDAWVATKPLKNPAAPLTPFAMTQYHLAAQDRAQALTRTAEAATAEAKVDNQRSDNYVLAVVLFASALFFAGI